MTLVEKLHGEKKLVSNVEVESSIVVSETESSELEALTENSQSFNELHLLLKEQSYAVNFFVDLFILSNSNSNYRFHICQATNNMFFFYACNKCGEHSPREAIFREFSNKSPYGWRVMSI